MEGFWFKPPPISLEIPVLVHTFLETFWLLSPPLPPLGISNNSPEGGYTSNRYFLESHNVLSLLKLWTDSLATCQSDRPPARKPARVIHRNFQLAGMSDLFSHKRIGNYCETTDVCVLRKLQACLSLTMWIKCWRFHRSGRWRWWNCLRWQDKFIFWYRYFLIIISLWDLWLFINFFL